MRRNTVLLVVLAACGSDSLQPGLDAQASPDAYADLSGPVFEPGHIVDVSITMARADWDTLRAQTRTIGSVIEGDCLAQPAPSPFTKFKASITIDGTTLPEVSVKKKGFFGSLDTEKPSLKVKLDEYVNGQEYLGLEKLTLNNARQDPAYLRQCIAYQAFAAAGIVVPRCNFAHVRVNNDDLGIYVNVETIDHHMTKKRYADGRGSLYEGTLSDFRNDWLGTFDAKGDGDGADLAPLKDVLESSTDARLVADLAPVIDLDRFYTYWAMEVITNHWDGYANNRNNFFVYHDPTTDKLDFIPWGPDGAMQSGATFGNLGSTTGPIAVAANGMLSNRLFAIAATRQKFLDRQRELLSTAWNEASLLAELDRMESLIGPIVDSVDGPGWRTDVDSLRDFVRGRRSALTTALDAGPTWTDPLPAYPCLTIVARVDATFSTTFGTIAAPDPFATGTGTMSMTAGSATTTLTPIGARAGFDPNAPPSSASAIVQVFGVRASDNHIIVASLSINRATLVPRAGDLGLFDAFGLVFDFNPVTSTATTVGFMLGTFTLSQASTTNGAMVVGSFTANADVQANGPPTARVAPTGWRPGRGAGFGTIPPPIAIKRSPR